MTAPTLPDLLAELAAAVRHGDRDRTADLERQILRRLADEAAAGTATAEHLGLERNVRELMAQLDLPGGGLESYDPRATKSSDAATDGTVYPVWFGTDRVPEFDGFGPERHDRVTRGRVEVFVPYAHRFGGTGTPFWRRLLRGDLRDDYLRIQDVKTLGPDAFFADLQEVMQAARDGGDKPHGLFFLHGFNVSFDEAAISAAQLGTDLKIPGATAFFSWPSRGSIFSYVADGAAIEPSEKAIADFLIDFATQSGAETVHVLAHSMGNRGLLRALQRIAADAQARGRVKLGQIILAAPDLDSALLVNNADVYKQHAARTTLYTSRSDLAVALSYWLNGAPRAGYFTPYTVAPGIDTVAVPRFNVELLGHSYYAKAEALLYDIRDLMLHDRPPDRRQRIAAVTHDGADFWELDR